MTTSYLLHNAMAVEAFVEEAARTCSRTPIADTSVMYDTVGAELQKMHGIKKEFSDKSKRKIVRAHQEAVRFGHDHLGSVHLLISLMLENDRTIAHTVLLEFGVEVGAVRRGVEKLVQRAEGKLKERILPQAPCFINTLKRAAAEASLLNFPVVGTEHLLIALLQEKDSVAVRVLKNLRISPDEVKQEVYRLLDVTPELLNVHLEEDARMALGRLQEILDTDNPSETIIKLLDLHDI